MNNSLVSVPFRQTTVWKVARAIFAVVVFLHVLFAATQITVRWDRLYIDTVTGTREHRREWITGWHSTRTQTSPLEARLIRAGITWKKEPKFVSGTYRALLGNTTCHACGTGSDMYFFDHDVMRTWADASSDDEIRAFLQAMKSDDSQIRLATIDRAMSKALDVLEAETKDSIAASNPR